MWQGQGRRSWSARKSRPTVEGLESRIPLSTLLPAAEVSRGAEVPFVRPSRSIVGLGELGEGKVQRVRRQDGNAEVLVRRSPTEGRAAVEFSTAVTPAAGASYLPVRELVRFEPGESAKVVNVPLSSLGPAPAEVEVPLYLRAQSPGVHIERPGRIISQSQSQSRPIGPRASGLLQISDRPDVSAPKVVSSTINRQGFEMTFSEPMDASRASYERNYRVEERADSSLLSLLNPFRLGRRQEPEPIRVREAHYDSATSTVTLVPNRPIDPSKTYEVRALDPYTVPEARQIREPQIGLRGASGNALEPTFLLVSRNPFSG